MRGLVEKAVADEARLGAEQLHGDMLCAPRELRVHQTALEIRRMMQLRQLGLVRPVGFGIEVEQQAFIEASFLAQQSVSYRAQIPEFRMRSNLFQLSWMKSSCQKRSHCAWDSVVISLFAPLLKRYCHCTDKNLNQWNSL